MTARTIRFGRIDVFHPHPENRVEIQCAASPESMHHFKGRIVLQLEDIDDLRDALDMVSSRRASQTLVQVVAWLQSLRDSTTDEAASAQVDAIADGIMEHRFLALTETTRDRKYLENHPKASSSGVGRSCQCRYRNGP